MRVLKGANLGLMFILEVCVLAGAIGWGCTLSAPIAVRVCAAVAAPAVFIVTWSLFGAGGGRNARYPLRGTARAALEIAWFGLAALLIGLAFSPIAGLVFFALWGVNAMLRLVWRQA
ncbi:DUF2568 domain-containing protein [Nocardia arthritidis]|uniref:DUF2568 domain-containing protein n=1 Tax=Nocardia arthritidis TaxID=228602 RepID=A0A6G9YGP0_9NOCA|nr:DUF2568 domain-containing protein [Nocardia arthritidis]QIS12344.1 DUF2568 domain-containing protein [Nocardia arthritidis]